MKVDEQTIDRARERLAEMYGRKPEVVVLPDAHELRRQRSDHRTTIEATPVLEPVDEPQLARTAYRHRRKHDALVASLRAHRGQWFRVFKNLPYANAANARVAALRNYEGIDAGLHKNPDGTADVYARARPHRHFGWNPFRGRGSRVPEHG